MRPPLPDPAHGTRRRYQLRRDPCRCSECRAANASTVARYRARGKWQQLAIPDDVYEKVGDAYDGGDGIRLTP